MATESGSSGAWRTRDIVVVAVIAVAFGVFFWAFGLAWSGLAALGPVQNVLYGGWLLPAIVAPLIVRKPGAALFAELVAAGAFIHDWLVYYATYDAGALAVLAGFMAVSGLVVLPLVAFAIVSTLRQT